MATTFTETTLSTTYKDDFRDSDNYHRILFNSGVGLQARELTQLQTILQKQIERFGNNIFVEGAMVKAGGIIVNNSFEFIKHDVIDPIPHCPLVHVYPVKSTKIALPVALDSTKASSRFFNQESSESLTCKELEDISLPTLGGR